jgi:hypothetical protein
VNRNTHAGREKEKGVRKRADVIQYTTGRKKKREERKRKGERKKRRGEGGGGLCMRGE